MRRSKAALGSEGPCYTFPSPTLRALEAALQEYATPPQAQATYARYAELGHYVRGELRRPDDSLVDGVDEDWDRFTDFAAGVAYMEFTEAVARSAQNGIAVELPLEVDLQE